jgi:hypothetical protein
MIVRQARIDVLKQGMIAGSLGYLAIILYYATANLLTGQSPFHTVAAIGQALFEPAAALPAAIAFNGVHLFAFLMLGWVAAWLIYRVELQPAIWHPALFALIAIFLLTSSVVAIVAGTFAHVSPLVVLIGNLLAAAAVGGYLGWNHPGLERRIELWGDPEAIGLGT